MPAGHDRRSDDGRPVHGCLAELERQVAGGVAQPDNGGEEPGGPVQLALGVLEIVGGLMVDEPGIDDPPGGLLVAGLDEPE